MLQKKMYVWNDFSAYGSTADIHSSNVINWAAANGGVTNGGLRGVWPPFLEIG